MSTGIWTTLVMPRTHINRQSTMTKYGCRNENVGIENPYSDWHGPADRFDSPKYLGQDAQCFTFNLASATSHRGLSMVASSCNLDALSLCLRCHRLLTPRSQN